MFTWACAWSSIRVVISDEEFRKLSTLSGGVFALENVSERSQSSLTVTQTG